jgi:peptide/nickel transport system substrate-binding protein
MRSHYSQVAYLDVTMKIAVLAVFLSFTTLLAGCRRPRSNESGPTGVANPAFEGNVPVDAYLDDCQPGDYGGTLVMSLPSNPRSFNPITAIDSSTIWVTQGLIYKALIDYDNSQQQIIPGLAKSWEASTDGLDWSFNLRRGVNWSDGQPFGADDVIFNLDLVFDPRTGSPSRSLFVQSDGSLPKYQKDGDYTVRFHLLEPNAEFLIAIGSVYLIPKHKWDGVYKPEDFARALTTAPDPRDMACLGPYRIVSFTPDERLVLERNPFFWKIDRSSRRLPYIDRVVFEIVPDLNTMALKFGSGEIDALYVVPPESVESLKQGEKTGDYTVHDLGGSLNTTYLMFNQDTGRGANGAFRVEPYKLAWFRNTKFRQAISYGIDRQGMIRTALDGRGVPLYTFVSPANRVWYTDNTEKYPYDPDHAKQLLSDAGIRLQAGETIARDEQGHPVQFTIYTNGNRPYRVNIATFIRSNLARIGVDAKVQPIDSNLLTDKLNLTRDFEAIVLGWQTGTPPDPVVSKNALTPGGDQYYAFPKQAGHFTDWEEQLRKLIAENARETELEARQRSFWQAMQIWSQYLPEIDLVASEYFVAAKNRIRNLKPSPLPTYTYWNIEELYFAR